MKTMTNRVLPAIACLCIAIVWTIPVAIMGSAPQLPTTLLHARNLAAGGGFVFQDSIGRILSTGLLPLQGVPSALDGRLSSLLYSAVLRWIPFSDFVFWSFIGSVLMAAGLFFLWQTMRKLLSPSVAWVTLCVCAFLPAVWFHAIYLGFYNPALLFLFASFAAFVCLRERSELLALIAAGVLYGGAVASKDVFLVFLPWYACSYVWVGRKHIRRTALLTCAFVACASFIYLLPYAGDIRTLGYPVNQNLARLWPGADDIASQNYLHLYPDPYTYHFDKEAFDTAFLAEANSKPFWRRVGAEKVILDYGLEGSLWRQLRLGTILSLGSIPSFFQRQNTGGVFLWLFAVPGMVVLWRRHRNLALWLLGLVLSMYFIIRFVLGYERDHFINIAWAFALCVSVGITTVAQAAAKHLHLSRVRWMYVGILVVVSLQLLQETRYELAYRYGRSEVSESFAIAKTLSDLPADAVVMLNVHPNRLQSIATLADRTVVLVRNDTVRNYPDVVDKYGITHALGYADAIANTKHIPMPVAVEHPISPALSFLLHLLR